MNRRNDNTPASVGLGGSHTEGHTMNKQQYDNLNENARRLVDELATQGMSIEAAMRATLGESDK